jgi:hypothetical protein
MSKTTNKFSPDVRERAVRLVLDNENTNGLLRQCLPKGTDISQHGAEELGAVAQALNTYPRKTQGWPTPAEALDRLLKQDMIEAVATTG